MPHATDVHHKLVEVQELAVIINFIWSLFLFILLGCQLGFVRWFLYLIYDISGEFNMQRFGNEQYRGEL